MKKSLLLIIIILLSIPACAGLKNQLDKTCTAVDTAAKAVSAQEVADKHVDESWYEVTVRVLDVAWNACFGSGDN